MFLCYNIHTENTYREVRNVSREKELQNGSGIAFVCFASWHADEFESYTEEEHIACVTERAKERFLGEGSEYTGLEVFPVYNEYDELKYMLIEFQPQGFLYVLIDREQFPWKMYTLSNMQPESWMPYRVKEGATDVITDENGDRIAYKNREFFAMKMEM